jgi:hypothetical protein
VADGLVDDGGGSVGGARRGLQVGTAHEFGPYPGPNSA